MGYPQIPANTVVGKELQEYATRGDEIYVVIAEYDDSSGETHYPAEGAVVKYKSMTSNTSMQQMSERNIDVIGFSDDIPDTIMSDSPERVVYDFKKIKTDSGETYSFNDFGEIVERSDGLEHGSSDTESTTDTQVFDP